MRAGGSISFIKTAIVLSILLLAQLSPGFILASAQMSPLLALSIHTAYPNDVVEILVTGASEPVVSVTDPAGVQTMVDLAAVNGSTYRGTYALSSGIILDYYTVSVLDMVSGMTAEDRFLVTSKTVPVVDDVSEPSGEGLGLRLSGSIFRPGEGVDVQVVSTAGMPEVTVLDPVGRSKSVQMYPAGKNLYTGYFSLTEAVVLGNYSVLATINDKGTYSQASADFVVMYDGLSPDMSVDYVAYDPVKKVIVIRAKAGEGMLSQQGKGIVESPAFSDLNVQKINSIGPGTGQQNNVYGKKKSVEIIVPATQDNIDRLIADYGIDKGIVAATVTENKIDNTTIQVSLDDKLDGSWYRIAVNIPSGYRIGSIVREDGIPIVNNYHIDRATGAVVNESLSWYVENGTLYFYDDPINTYDITLVPPAASNSLSLEVMRAGQITALVFPYNQSDSVATIRSQDHLGRTEDNGYAYELDQEAGTKSSIRLYNNNIIDVANRRVYGNDEMDTFGAQGEYNDISRTMVGFHAMADGQVESVIISNYSTPVGESMGVNIIQKTILRDNNQWFATVYYINNTHATLDYDDFRLYVGADFNFNGDYHNDNCYYSAVNDTVFGYTVRAVPSINFAGFKSPLHSSMHEVNQYQTVWNIMSTDAMANRTSYLNGDGGCSLAWDQDPLRHGQVWTVPVIYALSKNLSGFNATLDYAITHCVYDTGILRISAPQNGSSIDRLTTPNVSINVTAMDLGVTDENTTVKLIIRYPNGTICYVDQKYIPLSIPYNETGNLTFTWDISQLPIGTYNISAYTRLNTSDNRYIDQNESNDMKTIFVNIQSFAIYPDQTKQANKGDNVVYDLNVINMGSAKKLDLNLTASTKGWNTYLFDSDDSLIAYDNDTDLQWDWINASYKNNTNGQVEISLDVDAIHGLKLLKVVPFDADPGAIDYTWITINQAGMWSPNTSAKLTTYIPWSTAVNKTFYLHTNYMNTTPETAGSSSTTLRAYYYSFWSTNPAYASTFNIQGNVSAYLYLTPSADNLPITITAFYTNGVTTFNIGSITSTLGDNVGNWYNFLIPIENGFQDIPKGYRLVLKIDNHNGNDITLSHSSGQRSRIEVSTGTYVNVDRIDAVRGTTYTTVFLPGDTAKIIANVTDPIGAYDVPTAAMTVYYPNYTILVNNATMSLNRTDTTQPPFYRTFDGTFTFPAGVPAGKYNVSVTGYESNGVIHNKNLTIILASSTPAVDIFPNWTKNGTNGEVVSFKHTVWNLYFSGSDVFEIFVNHTMTWPYELFEEDGVTPLTDHDGDGNPDTGTLAALESKDIVVNVTIPGATSTGINDTILVKAYSSQDTTKYDIAYDMLTSGQMNKTLYLHSDLTLRTSKSPSGTSRITRNTEVTWAMNSSYAMNFSINGNVSVTLHYMQASANTQVNVYLFSNNSTGSALIGQVLGQSLGSDINAYRTISFTVPITSGGATIPRGNKLELVIRNTQPSGSIANRWIDIYETPARPSRLDFNTTTFIHISESHIYDFSGVETSTFAPGDTMTVRANITDPFGAYDICDVNVIFAHPNGTTISGPTAMTLTYTDAGSPSVYKLFSQGVSIPGSLADGDYIVSVIANETNSVKSVINQTVTIRARVDLTATKTITSLGGNEYRVTITLHNNNARPCTGVHVFDFYDDSLTVHDFSHLRAVEPVTWQGGGYVNTFGAFSLAANGQVTITYQITATDASLIPDQLIVGVDPVV